jgi:hypothetical protein
MECRDRVDELERYAIARHHKSEPESRGLCFQASLTLAEEARGLNLEGRAGFVRWSVRRDQAFLEHWALVLDGAKVVDMTAVQVDGNPDPLRRLASYPTNYVRPRQYPVTVVLDVMEHHVSGTGRTFSRRLLGLCIWPFFAMTPAWHFRRARFSLCSTALRNLYVAV